ncbi:MAG: hypothetical protein H6R14_1410 [Proteobacteria bacterium]|nr:hypothetical protein [Pseudomonadota bacterium]
MGEYKQSQRSLLLMCAAVTLALATMPSDLMADETSDVANGSHVASMSAQKTRVVRLDANGAVPSEESVRLLESIPDDHPLRSELRRIAMSEPPVGYSADQWLRLSMKFDFRTPGSAAFRNRTEGF